MEKLKKTGFKFALNFMVGIVVGIIIGISTFSILVSYRMDTYYKRIAYLENTIKDKDDRLEKLERSVNLQHVILKDICIDLIFQGDEIDKIDIEKTIKEKYRSLLGKEVKTIDADILVEVVDKRILKIEDREYKLQVDRVVLTEILKLTIKADPIDKNI